MLETIKQVLEDYEKEYSDYALTEMLKRWESSKGNLITLLSKHPCWRDNIKAIVVPYKEIRNNHKRYSYLRELLFYIDSCVVITDEIKKILNEFECWELNQFLDEEIISCINNVTTSFSFKKGMKTSRAINKVLSSIGADQFPCYNKLFANFADSVNPLFIDRTAVLSVNPIDFLLMSNGTGWKSCHLIAHGEYMAGTLSYMGDATSMIFYTTDEEREEFIPLSDKITRNVFCYHDGKLLQSRLYPNNDEQIKEKYRQLVQSIFAECLSLPNIWKLNKKFGDVEECVTTTHHSLHYADYKHPQYNPNISVLKDYSQVGENIVIGSIAHCVECDVELTSANSILCTEEYSCEQCGCRLSEDEVCWVNSCAYCSDCAYYCDCCGNYVENITRIEDDVYVCDSCIEKYYVFCEDCNTYHHRDNSTYIDGEEKYVCNKCLDNYFVCEQCGMSFSFDDANLHDDEYYCNSCFEDIENNKLEVA